MKKLILSTVLIAFAVAAQASDAKPKDATAEKPSCCAAKMATKADVKAEGSCSMSEGGCCGQAKQSVSIKRTVAAKRAVVKVVLASPKAASL